MSSTINSSITKAGPSFTALMQLKENITNSMEHLQSLGRPALVKDIAEAATKNPDLVADIFIHLISTIKKVTDDRDALAVVHAKSVDAFHNLMEEQGDLLDLNDHLLSKNNHAAILLPLYPTRDIPDEDDQEVRLPSSPLSSIMSRTPSPLTAANLEKFNPGSKRARSPSIASDGSSVQLDEKLLPIPKIKKLKTKPAPAEVGAPSMQMRKTPKKHPNVHHCTLTKEELRAIRPSPSESDLKRFQTVKKGNLPRFIIDDAEFGTLLAFRGIKGGKGRWRGKTEVEEENEEGAEEEVEEKIAPKKEGAAKKQKVVKAKKGKK